MADRIAARSTSRRKTPTPQPPARDSMQAGRTTRGRGARSASRDVEAVEPSKPIRRSARQASVTSAMSDSEQERVPARKARRKAQGRAAADLTTVEELDTHLEIEDAPQTPPRPTEVPAGQHSPGAASEMSGTTAISSFSLDEAELLEDRLILRHLPFLHQACQQFLDHLVPDEDDVDDLNERIRNDDKRVNYMQMPDSPFVADYNDFDNVLAPHLPHFRGDQQYIHLRAVRRALFGPKDVSQTGLDLILYQANLVIFAKDMVHTDRGDKAMWDSIRALENQFPTRFVPSLVLASDPSASIGGDSALLQETFELALDLRTQLAILFLARESQKDHFNPDDVLEHVFMQPHDDGSSFIRGWGVSALGGEDAALPQPFQSSVVDRYIELRRFFPTDGEALEGENVDIDQLGEAFPWRMMILRLLGWVRLRKAELRAAFASTGGLEAIVETTKMEMQKPRQPGERNASVPRPSPRKKRTSFGRYRRRSSRKFDPLADLDSRVLDKLRAKERLSGETALEQDQVQLQSEDDAVAYQQAPRTVEDEAPKDVEEDIAPIVAPEDERLPTLSVNNAQHPMDAHQEPLEEAPGRSQPPKSTSGILNLLKQATKTGKENRMVTNIFARQPDAVREEFGDGFGDQTQPIAGPSGEGRHPQLSAPTKRRVEDISDEEEETFQAESRTAKVQERRADAKRVRIAPTTSGAPTSHQPRRAYADADFEPHDEADTGDSEVEAPNMTEEIPPASTFAHQRNLAQGNTLAKPRKAPTRWTAREEETLVEYMARFPHRYSDMLKHDESEEGHSILRGRTQVNIKDKVRNMAITMIKSGTGLKNGFEHVVTKSSKHGVELLNEGYDW